MARSPDQEQLTAKIASAEFEEVQCRTNSRPWAHVKDSEGRIELRPLKDEEIVLVPAIEAVQLDRQKHVTRARSFNVVNIKK